MHPYLRQMMAATALALAAGGAPLHAQDTTRLLSNEGVERAAAASPGVIEARAEVARVRAGLASRGVFPEPLEVEGAWHTDAPFDAEGGGGFEVAVRQQIDLAGARSASIAAARAELAAAELRERSAVRDAVLEYRLAVARLIESESQVQLADTLLAAARRLETLAARLVAEGEMARLDATGVETDRLRAELELEKARTELASARIALALLLDLPATTIPVIADSERNSPSPGELATRARQLLNDRDAVPGGRRRELIAIDSTVAARRFEADAARRETGPRLTLGLGLISESTVLTAEDLEGASESVRTGFGTLRDRGLLLGLDAAITLPIAGLHDRGEIETARADAEESSARMRRQLLTRTARAEMADALARLEGAERRLALYQSRGRALDSTVRTLLERGFAAGELSALEVITRRDASVRLREEEIAARRELMEAAAQLERLLND